MIVQFVRDNAGIFIVLAMTVGIAFGLFVRVSQEDEAPTPEQLDAVCSKVYPKFDEKSPEHKATLRGIALSWFFVWVRELDRREDSGNVY